MHPSDDSESKRISEENRRRNPRARISLPIRVRSAEAGLTRGHLMEAAGRNIFGKRFASLRRAGRAMMETGKAGWLERQRDSWLRGKNSV
jgi:hypothetical protein